MMKITNLLEVNTNDTLGTAVVKGAVKGYLQGVLATGVAIGALAVGVKILSDMAEVNSDEKIEEEQDIEDLDKEWTEIRIKAEETLERNKNIDVLD